MTYLESIRNALRQALTKDERVLLLGEDISDPYGGAFKVTKGLSTEFPGRLINTPLSEPSITGVATGLALRGLRPVLEIMFGDFLTLCADQLINHATKFSWMYNGAVSVPLVIRIPMGGHRGYGPTHSQTTEKLLFGFPMVKVVAPSHFHNPGHLLEKALEEEEVVLFVENKLLYPEEIVDTEEGGYYQDFQLRHLDTQGYGTALLSSSEADENPMVSVITYGGMSPIVFSAMRRLFLEEETTCEIVVPSLIKPLPLRELEEAVKRSGRAVIAEEGHLSWGWGAEVATKIAEVCHGFLKAPVMRVAARDLPIPNARPLEEEVLPGEKDVIQAVLKVIRA